VIPKVLLEGQLKLSFPSTFSLTWRVVKLTLVLPLYALRNPLYAQ